MNMRYSISLAVLAVATLLSFPGTARAAMMDGPPGTYLDTCRDVHMRGDTLVAKCQKVDNHWRDTSLDDVYRCVGDIANLDGRLQCSRTPTRPAGDYAETCRDIRMRVNTLYAKCKTMDGYWVETQLDGFSRCRGPIANVNGQLRCGDPDWDRDRDRDRGRGWATGHAAPTAKPAGTSASTATASAPAAKASMATGVIPLSMTTTAAREESLTTTETFAAPGRVAVGCRRVRIPKPVRESTSTETRCVRIARTMTAGGLGPS